MWPRQEKENIVSQCRLLSASKRRSRSTTVWCTHPHTRQQQAEKGADTGEQARGGEGRGAPYPRTLPPGHLRSTGQTKNEQSTHTHTTEEQDKTEARAKASKRGRGTWANSHPAPRGHLRSTGQTKNKQGTHTHRRASKHRVKAKAHAHSPRNLWPPQSTDCQVKRPGVWQCKSEWSWRDRCRQHVTSCANKCTIRGTKEGASKNDLMSEFMLVPKHEGLACHDCWTRPRRSSAVLPRLRSPQPVTELAGGLGAETCCQNLWRRGHRMRCAGHARKSPTLRQERKPGKLVAEARGDRKIANAMHGQAPRRLWSNSNGEATDDLF